MRNDGLTEQEGKVMDALFLAVDEFHKLESQHYGENSAFIDGIHKCQYVLSMRVLRRDYPQGYPTYNRK